LKKVRLKKLKQRNGNRRYNIEICATKEDGDDKTLRRQIMKKKRKITSNDTKTTA
jgi:hypothetical protein